MSQVNDVVVAEQIPHVTGVSPLEETIIEATDGQLPGINTKTSGLVTRREFVSTTVGAAFALGVTIGGVDKIALQNLDSISPEVESGQITDLVQKNFSGLGMETVTIENKNGEKKEVLMPKSERVRSILRKADNDLNNPDEENAYGGDQLDVILDLSDVVREEVEEEMGMHLEDNQLMDVVGSIVAAWGIANGFIKGGITTADYARVTAFTAVAYLVGREERRTHLRHNLEETVTAVRDIGVITEVSDFVIAQKKGIIAEFMKEQAVTPGVDADELESLFARVKEENPALLPQLEARLADFEHESVEALIDQLRTEGATDTATILDALSAIKFENMSRTEALRTLILLGNTLGPLLTTLVSTSVLSPLCRAIASDGNGGFDKDVMSILQSYIPNNFGLSGLGFIPGYYDLLGKATKGIPVAESAFVAADFGPRLAIMQKSGEHGTEVLSILDGVNVITQLGMMGGFAAEMSHAIAKLEAQNGTRVTTGSVLTDVMNPTKYAGAMQALFKEYGLGLNIKDALFGRVQRAMGVVYNAFDPRSRHLKHGAHSPVESADNYLSRMKARVRNLFAAADGADVRGKDIRGAVNEVREVFSHLTNVHNWESAVGPELTDIFKTLPFQSLCVPYVEGVAKMVVGAIENVVPADLPQFARDQIVDLATYTAFGVMSTSFDNFAANKAALTVALGRIRSMMEAGLIENPRKRITAVVKKMYDAAVIFGGMLPLGNMPNFKMFPLNLYTLADAIKRFPRRLIPAIVAFFTDSSMEFLGAFPEMDPAWFFDDVAEAH